jgi:hypothetical protein
LELSFFDSILQDHIDTVTVEGVENVGEEDWIEIKTEEDYIELVGRVMCEREVSVLFCFVVVICVQVCVCVVLYIMFTYTLFSYLLIKLFQFLPFNHQMYLCDTFCLIAVCPNYYLSPFPNPSPAAAILLVAISIDVV